jgi:hypothetical protein
MLRVTPAGHASAELELLRLNAGWCTPEAPQYQAERHAVSPRRADNIPANIATSQAFIVHKGLWPLTTFGTFYASLPAYR